MDENMVPAPEQSGEQVEPEDARDAADVSGDAAVSEEAVSGEAEPGDGKPSGKGKKKPRRPGQSLFEWGQALAVSVCAIVVIFTFFARIIGVNGDSMNPTLTNGDRVVISDLFYTPKHGDIVVLHAAGFSEPLIKRVIAVEGETVRVEPEEGRVYVNGVALDEEYTAEPTLKSYDMLPSVDVIVPDGCVFVMGDNRNHSSDSRSNSVGMVDERQIIGRAFWRLLPAENFGGL